MKKVAAKSNHILQMPSLTPLESMASGQVLPQMQSFPEVYYWLWLADVLGPANPNAGRILDVFGDAATAYYARESEQFTACAGKTIADRVAGQEINPKTCAQRVEACEKHGIAIVTGADAEYPLPFLRIPDLPPVIYCTGDLTALQADAMVSMVGTRAPTAYGLSAAAHFGRAFARSGAVIVSGLADGLDAECHRAALAEQAPTIAIMGTPISKTFPAVNATLRNKIEASGGVTVSEYPDGFYAGKTRSTFLQRNRLIAALADALVVIEARSKSGTMSTVAHAERYEKTVYAVPGSVFSLLSEGTNQLISEGRAKVLVQSDSLLAELGLRVAEQTPVTAVQAKPPLQGNAKKIFASVTNTPYDAVEIAGKSGVPFGVALSVLGALELEGRIVSTPGQKYMLP